MLPESVMRRAREELLDWHGTGLSVMEMSHRSKAFASIAEKAEADLRELLSVPDHYHVLFLQGGASSQFAMVPLNLLGTRGSADYLCTGSWSKKAIAEAQRYCTVNVATTSEADHFTSIRDPGSWQLHADAAFVHYTPNETIHGVEFHRIPETGAVPLVGDFSSTLLSRPLDVSRHGLIYAGAQKNMGPAGLCVVIVRADLITAPRAGTPAMFTYKNHVEARSMYNTPPTYPWYVAGLVFEWLQEQGGLEAMAHRNRRRAEKLYAAIDADAFYHNPVRKESRSWMNVPFTLANSDLDERFIEQAAREGLHELKGHRSVGGMRASLYNGMPDAGVEALIDFMVDFSRRHG